jgi:hypothetical protein
MLFQPQWNGAIHSYYLEEFLYVLFFLQHRRDPCATSQFYLHHTAPESVIFQENWDCKRAWGTETIRGLRGHTGNNLHSIIHPLFPPFPLACDKTLPG